MKMPISKGNVVISKKGRDKGRYFVVLYMLDAVYACIADGDTRKLSHPKKKKVMHLNNMPVLLNDLIALYEANQLKDSDIKKALTDIKQVPDAH